MKKIIRIITVVISILIILIILDTGYARVKKDSPYISIKHDLGDGSYVMRGVILDTYYCRELVDAYIVNWKLKFNGYKCPTPKEKLDVVGEIFTRTYNVKAIYESDEENKKYYTLSIFQDELDTINTSNINIELNKNYEITFKIISNDINDNIESIFKNCEVLEVKETDKIGLEQIQELYR